MDGNLIVKSQNSFARPNGLMISAFHSESSDARSTLAGGIVCSWARRTILTVPLSNKCYERVPANFKAGGSLEIIKHPILGGRMI